MIELHNISKSFTTTPALSDITLAIESNQIFGLIGPDGAGKTTLLNIIATLLLPDSGECRIKGLNGAKDYKHIRKILGLMPATFSLYADLSVQENLEFFAAIFGVDLRTNLESIWEIYRFLEPFKTRRAGALSGGMKQKLSLCCALIHKPEILLLDEPTTGVDAVSRREFWEILSKLKNEMTIIASTPYMDEASLCDRVALIHNGKILSVESPQNIIASFPHKIYSLAYENALENAPAGSMQNPSALLEQIRALPFVHSCFLFGGEFHIVFKSNQSHEVPPLKALSGVWGVKGGIRGATSRAAQQTHTCKFKPPCPPLKKKSQADLNIGDSNNEKSIESLFAKLKEIKPTIEDCFMEFLL